MADNDILIEILKSKEKLWSDKKRLGILTENGAPDKDSQHAALLQNSRQDEKARLAERLASGSPGFGRKLPHKQCPRYPVTLPEDVRDKKKAELISKLTEPQAAVSPRLRQETPRRPVTVPDDLRARKKAELISRLSEVEDENDLEFREELMSPAYMVRFGEYSPLNPGILSPGKTLLGLGDWEEKRRQIVERKKKEYMELMSQARQEAAQQPHFCTIVSKPSVGTQTDLTITGYMADTTTPPGSSGRSPVNPPSSHNYLNVSTATQTAKENVQRLCEIKLSERSSSPFLALSPRERKVAETYSPSFLANHNVLDGFTSPQEEEHLSEIARRRREAYQEELRKQIEEKRRLEAERQVQQRREEEAIARRAEQQRERMKQEYEMEEARRRELKIQRTRQVEQFQRRQEELRLQDELEREMQQRRRLEKRLADLEAGLNAHNVLHSQSPRQLETSLPVPALRTRQAAVPLSQRSDTSLPAHHCTEAAVPLSQRSETSLPAQHCTEAAVPLSQRSETSLPAHHCTEAAPPLSSRRSDNSLPAHHSTEAAPPLSSRRSEISLPAHHCTEAAPPLSSRRSDTSLPAPVRSSHSSRRTTPVPTLSYHRPPAEILKAAGYAPELLKSDASSAAKTNSHPPINGVYNPELYKSDKSCSPLSAPEAGKGCNNDLLIGDTVNVGISAPVKLDDSLPIPVLRAPSPVIPASQRKSPKEGSEAMRRLEGKWEVPAVEKNVVYGSNPNNILTQLGAVRHRMQLEQQRMEQYLKQKS